LVVLIELVLTLAIPLGLDLYLPVPESNPLTAEKVALGRQLFFDRRLSADGSISCASCHNPGRAFADARPVAVGIFGRRGTRNAPSLINRAWGRSFFWDGRTTTLEAQVLRPIEDPNEMGSSVAAGARRVGRSPDELRDALASYVRSILAGNSAFDRYAAGDRRALSPEAQAGLRVFRGKGNCSTCHIGPTLTDEAFHNTGVAVRDGRVIDVGRAAVTGRAADRGAFKTPTLREVARTAPYMHDGSLATLEDVIDFYDRGGRPSPALDADIRPLNLSAAEKRALAAFLRALSGDVRAGAIERRLPAELRPGRASPGMRVAGRGGMDRIPVRRAGRRRLLRPPNPLEDPIRHVKQPLSRRTRGKAVLEFEPIDVRHIRAKFSATQKEFARLIGISAETLRSWETGRRRPPGSPSASAAWRRRGEQYSARGCSGTVSQLQPRDCPTTRRVRCGVPCPALGHCPSPTRDAVPGRLRARTT
jgi:cytochrome c peroxidase